MAHPPANPSSDQLMPAGASVPGLYASYGFAPPIAAKTTTLGEYARLWEAGQEGLLENPMIRGPDKPYKQVSWIFACVRAIADPAGRVPIRISRGAAKGTRGVWGLKGVRQGRMDRRVVCRHKDACLKAQDGEIVEGGPLVDYLAKPNPQQTWSQFAEALFSTLYAVGRVHWLHDEMVGRRPVSSYVISGRKTTPIVDKSGRFERLVGWKLRTPEGGEERLDLEELVTFQFFDPDDPMRGMTPYSPAQLAVVSHYNAWLYNAAMFGNSCEPGGVLESESEYNPEQDAQIKTTWQQRHGGSVNARRLAILWGGLKYNATGVTMSDMQFPEGLRLTREEICAVYRVPPTVAGFVGTTGDSTAMADGEQKRFWQDTEGPLLGRLAEAITEHIAPRFAQGLEAWADVEDVPIVQDTRRSQLSAAKDLAALHRPWSDINQWLDLGLPERPWDETGFGTTSEVPVEQLIDGAVLPPQAEGPAPGADNMDGGPAPGPDAGDSAPNETPGETPNPQGPKNESARRGAVTSVTRVRRVANAPALSEIEKLAAGAVWRAWERSWAPLARRASVMLTAHYRAQERAVCRLIRQRIHASPTPRTGSTSQKVPPPQGMRKDSHTVIQILVEVFDDRTERERFVARCQRVTTDSTRLGLAQSLTESRLSPQEVKARIELLMQDPQIAEAARREAAEFARRVNAWSRNRLRKTLLEGLAAGEDARHMADRVQEYFGSQRGSALRYSRNFIGTTLSRARSQARAEAGYFTHELWIHSRGPGVRREGHVAAEAFYRAHPKPIGEPFLVNGVELRWPRDGEAPAAEVINCQCLEVGVRIEAGKAAPAYGAVLAQALRRGFVGVEWLAEQQATGNRSLWGRPEAQPATGKAAEETSAC